MTGDIRCRKCERLLGIAEKGQFVNKHGRQVIRTDHAVVVCPRCGKENRISSGEEQMLQAVEVQEAGKRSALTDLA